MDTTQDISKVDQLSQIYRYVEILKSDSGVPVQITIKESFLGFKAIKDQSAYGIAERTLNFYGR